MTKLAWESQPYILVGVFLIEIIGGMFPIANAWITKLIFDLLTQNLQSISPALSQELILLLTAQLFLAILGYGIGLFNSYLKSEMGRKLTIHAQAKIYGKINTLTGLTYFEHSEFYNTIELASQGAQRGPSRTLYNVTTILRNLLVLLSFIGTLLLFNPLLVIVLSVAIMPQFYAQMKMGRQKVNLAVANTLGQRQASYYGNLLSNNYFIKEIRLLNLADWLLNLLLQTVQRIQGSQRQQEIRELKWQSFINLISTLISTGAFIFIVIQAFAKQLSLGDVTLYTSAVNNVMTSLSGIILSFSVLKEDSLFFTHYTKLMTLPPDISATVTRNVREVPPLRNGIELQDVSFRYTDSHPWVLRGVSLFIPMGQCIALVGLNGTGKTTLVKLLTRLYDPTEGRILWDGIDIREFNPDDLRNRIGTIFQDFIRYDLTVRENIAFGDIRYINDDERIVQTAQKTGVCDFVNSLPQGYETVLSRWLVDDSQSGFDLSGGQWQKLALARMFMRNADFYILDEPTAALDAQAENVVYDQFGQLTASRTALLISHRFSTIHIAQQIAVLDGGKIVEYGSHKELYSLGGIYYNLYSVQNKYHGPSK